MSSTKGASKPPPSSSTGTSQPFNEFDDLHDPNDLPPAYDPSPGPSQGTSHSIPPRLPPNNTQHHAAQGFPGAQYHAQQWPMQNQLHYAPFQQQHPTPFNYPAGYYCQYCHNTGIKPHNGHPCGNCERLFGRQAGHVQYAPPGVMPVGGVTYMAGDPRIGGRLCGNCKGRGIKASMFGFVEEQCYVCRGVGRILG